MTTTRFRIHYDYIDQSNDPKLTEVAAQHLLQGEDAQHEYDDLALVREEWLKDEKCTKVVLDSITVYHSSLLVMGLRAQYRLEFKDESPFTLQDGAMFYFAKGTFSFPCDTSAGNDDIIKLKVSRNESIIKVRPERKGIKGKAAELSNSAPTQFISV